MSAMKSGMSRNTARKYLRQNDVTEQRRVPHTWRTREDPLEGIWPQAEEMLRQAPELEAKALFKHLAARQPEPLKPGLLRTFQRRVKAWVSSPGSRRTPCGRVTRSGPSKPAARSVRRQLKLGADDN